jgi:hypothetical protein
MQHHASLSRIANIVFAWALFALIVPVCQTDLAPINAIHIQPFTVGWYNSSWLYRKKITIDKNKVAGTAMLVNFPVEINLIDPDLRNADHGGRVRKSNGGDILFTASNGITRLDHEMETYVGATGELNMRISRRRQHFRL